MLRVVFTRNLERHVPCPPAEVEAATIKEALDRVFEANEPLKSYVVDDQGRLRKHMVVFVDSELIHDREGMTDEVQPNSEIYVMQALSGG
ncbi:MAG: MoaD/ThiS family protein [Planctomycetota bacterium]|jgi:signal recognition particle GTPase|nr:MoaD/ThiS family protein [Planctomycetota bacterium]MDP7251458.1 MoaD/ThiS family protein [Planctomycetota bacterium]